MHDTACSVAVIYRFRHRYTCKLLVKEESHRVIMALASMGYI